MRCLGFPSSHNKHDGPSPQSITSKVRDRILWQANRVIYLFMCCFLGMAVHHTNETHFPDWLPWSCLPLWGQWEWHCAEGSGKFAILGLLSVLLLFVSPADHFALHPSCLIPRSRWRRSVTQRITSVPFWREQKPNTYRKPITSHPGALLRISWKNWPFARENCSRCDFWLWSNTQHAKVQFQLGICLLCFSQ